MRSGRKGQHRRASLLSDGVTNKHLLAAGNSALKPCKMRKTWYGQKGYIDKARQNRFKVRATQPFPSAYSMSGLELSLGLSSLLSGRKAKNDVPGGDISLLP